MKIAIIGCGLIGEKRAKSLGNNQLVIVADKDIKKAKFISKLNNQNAIVTDDWKQAASHKDVDLVIVAVTNDYLAEIGTFSVECGKHVLVEKPAARSVDEVKGFLDRTNGLKAKVKVGFNLRYHPAIAKAKEIVDSGEIGELMFLRGRYGHGGRVGYEKEWRAIPEISGGGELLDQGVHLIDLSRWFMDDFEYIDGFAHTYFWNMPVDDNGFVSLRTKDNKVAWLHVSCTEWKNMFCMEIYGKKGKLQIDGLGGSYGIERLSFYKMHPQMGPPETMIWEYPGEDVSWKNEFADLIDSIEKNKPINGNLEDAYRALDIVNRIYKGKKI